LFRLVFPHYFLGSFGGRASGTATPQVVSSMGLEGTRYSLVYLVTVVKHCGLYIEGLPSAFHHEGAYKCQIVPRVCWCHQRGAAYPLGQYRERCPREKSMHESWFFGTRRTTASSARPPNHYSACRQGRLLHGGDP
jgi:hypothetical protein